MRQCPVGAGPTVTRLAVLGLLVAAVPAGCADTGGGSAGGPVPSVAAPSAAIPTPSTWRASSTAGAPSTGGRAPQAATPAGTTPSPAAPRAASSTVAPPPSGALVTRRVRGTFALYTAGAAAITYDPAVVPPGSTATVSVQQNPRAVTVGLAVTGLLPRRRYGIHLHTSACGPSVDQAGPHYQHVPDPAAVASPPSVDPRYANPRNEVWLDLTTDARGAGTSKAVQGWPFDGINPPGSVVLHARATATAPGSAGVAGPRVACLSLPH